MELAADRAGYRAGIPRSLFAAHAGTFWIPILLLVPDCMDPAERSAHRNCVPCY